MTYDNLIFITNILIAIYGALVGVLIYFSNKNQYMGTKSTAFLKTVIGVTVVITACISWYLLRNFSVRSDFYFVFQAGIIIAITISVISEYFSYNIGIDERRFKACLALELIAYILFIAVECIIYRVWITEAIITVALIVILQLTVNKTAYLPDTGSKRIYLAVTVASSFLLAKAAAVVIKEKSYNTLMFAAGAALIFLAYIFMRLWGGASDRGGYANARLITFYGGLMLIAVSISPEYLDFFAF